MTSTTKYGGTWPFCPEDICPDSKRFRREGEKEENRPLFRSTLFPPDKTLIRGSNVRELAEEVLGIING
jgi:hypothetical protein